MGVAHASKNIILLKLGSDDDVLALLGAHYDCLSSQIKFYCSCIVGRISEEDSMLEKQLRLVRVLQIAPQNVVCIDSDQNAQ